MMSFSQAQTHAGGQRLRCLVVGMPPRHHHTAQPRSSSCACLAFQEATLGKVSSRKPTCNTCTLCSLTESGSTSHSQSSPSLLPNLIRVSSSPLLQDPSPHPVPRRQQGPAGELCQSPPPRPSSQSCDSLQEISSSLSSFPFSLSSLLERKAGGDCRVAKPVLRHIFFFLQVLPD